MERAKLFNRLLSEAIDEVLSGLGEPLKNHTYIKLETDYSIERTRIPWQIDAFSELLHRIFGTSAYFLEVKMMKPFFSKVKKELTFKNPVLDLTGNELTFASYVNEMRDNLVLG